MSKNIKKNKRYKYFFETRKTNFTRKFFEKGLNAAVHILFTIGESSKSNFEMFITNLPSCYPGFGLMKSMAGCNSKKSFGKKIIKVNLERLEKEGLIAKTENQEFYLTVNGEEMVTYIKNRYSILEKPWDGKIRVVVFDIPEYNRRNRIWLREELLLLKFKELQKSVYVGKYPMPDEFYQDLIKNDIFDYVHLFTIESFDKDDKIIKLLEEE